jgi:pimeloyl-ACP methyl ester carboxylesterase
MEIAGTPTTNPEEAAEEAVAMKKAIGSPVYPVDESTVRDIGRRSFERSPGAEEDDQRQRAAVIASGDRRKKLADLRIPTLVIHGDRDSLIRPKGGRATANAVSGAKLVTYPDMGHDIPRALWPSILDEICAMAAPKTTAPKAQLNKVRRTESR